MYNRKDIVKDLRKLGIKETDSLMVHSSMKAIGDCENGADTVLDALMEAVGGGLLVLPTHTWASMNEEHSLYDPIKEPSCVGILTELFRQRPGVKRSLHPTHSVAAWGKDAENFTSGQENESTPCSLNSCYHRFYERNGKILLIGCTFNRNTFLHGVEEWFQIKERLTDWTMPLKIQMPDGSQKECKMQKHFKPGGISISEYYEKIRKPWIREGIVKEDRIGNAEAYLMDAKVIADRFTEILKQDRDAFLDNRPL